MNNHMLPVRSSQIQAIGYHPGKRILTVRFHPRKGQERAPSYEYTGVSPEIFAKFHNSESKGSHFHKNIKGKFDGKQIPFDN